MKILCICQMGNSRSVGLAFMLKNQGHDAIAIGIRAARHDTREMLYKWADKIIVTVAKYAPEIPQEYKAKVKVYDVGPDIYFRGYEPELLNQYENYLKNDPL